MTAAIAARLYALPAASFDTDKMTVYAQQCTSSSLNARVHVCCVLGQGAGSQEFAQQLRQHFSKVAWARPAATRSESREIYLLGLGRKF